MLLGVRGPALRVGWNRSWESDHDVDGHHLFRAASFRRHRLIIGDALLYGVPYEEKNSRSRILCAGCRCGNAGYPRC